MGARSKYRKIADLYVRGKELVFDDGTVMWVQVLNDFERAECRRAAQAERGKLVMALRELDTPEWRQLQGAFYSQTRDLTIDELVNGRLAEWYVKVADGIQNDPDWAERREILSRADEVTALPEEDPQRQLVDKLNREWVDEIDRRLKEERDFYTESLTSFSEDELLTEYKERWVERRGTSLALAEYNLSEVFHVARVCDAVVPDEGEPFDHSACKSHAMRVFETLAEVRDLPDELILKIRAVLELMAMTERDARFSDRSLSSSSPSQGPEQPADSTPSIPSESELQPLGT